MLLWQAKCYCGRQNAIVEGKVLLWKAKCYCGRQNAIVGGKIENGIVASPESILIHFNVICPGS